MTRGRIVGRGGGVDSNNFCDSLWPLTFFGRHVKRVVPRLTGRDNFTSNLFFTFIHTFAGIISSTTQRPDDADLPCVFRVGDFGQGYICVCNSTYCDTVNIPSQLESDQFYHYKTSNSSPGFTKTVGNFHKHSVINVVGKQ